MKIENNQECFVQLWLRLEHTRRLLEGRYKRFCIRSVLKSWFGLRATDDFIWEVCSRSSQEGWNNLPPPMLCPRPNREMLRAPRLSRPRHRNTQSAPFRTRQSLQHRVPQQHPVNCEQKETKLKRKQSSETVAALIFPPKPLTYIELIRNFGAVINHKIQ